MKEAAEERIRYIESVQMPLFEKAAKERKAPEGWINDMKNVVSPLSIASVRKFALICDESSDLNAFIEDADCASPDKTDTR